MACGHIFSFANTYAIDFKLAKHTEFRQVVLKTKHKKCIQQQSN